MQKLLLVEDNVDLGDILSQYLVEKEFNVVWCKNGEDAIIAFKKQSFDICILDIMLPKKDGFTIAREIHEFNPQTPFIFLTARQSKEDRIKGLKLLADDYITKPFDVEELVYRIHNILRRAKGVQDETVFTIGNYTFDYGNYTLNDDVRNIKLTQHETALLKYLFEHLHKLIRREDLLIAVWGESDFFHGRSMDVYITRLRKYFRDDPRIYIESTRGVGITFGFKS